jgi:putative ABC transport system permease protein
MPLARRIANLFRRSHVDREIDAELRSHIEMRAADNLAAGMSREDALRDALLRFGNPATTKERTAAEDAALAIESVGRDVRYALRQLRRSPGFAATAIVILALGIGASTAIFSAVDPILFEPLPYPHASRIMMIWDIYRGRRSDITYGTYRELAERSRSFEALAAFEPWQPAITGGDKPERLDGQTVSASYFHMIGVSPVLGRDFLPAEDVFNGPKVAILSDRLWRRRFAADRAVVGSQVKLSGDNYTVIGVMPKSFENVMASSTEIWTPLHYDTRNMTDFASSVWGHHLHMAGRLRAGVSLDQARRELAQIGSAPEMEFPRPRWAALSNGFIVDSLQDDMVRGVKPALLAILGAVLLVLLIACVNVTSLLLARCVQRRSEFAMRATLGAAKARLIRQSLTESLLLAIFGGALGIVVAEVGVRVLVALSPPGLPRVDAIAVDGPIPAFALAIATLVGLAAGLIPALQAPSANLQIGLQQTSRMTGTNRQWTRRTLVVSEVALALILLVGAGLLLRSMQRLLSVDPGFSAANLLTMQVQTFGHQFDELPSAPGVGDAKRRLFFQQALEQVRKVPGVESAAFTSLLPLSDDPSWLSTYGVQFEDGGRHDDGPQGGQVFRYAASPGYCQTMGIPLLRGRFLDERDVAGAPQSALISQSLARRRFPGQDPIGKRLHVGPTDRPWYTVVGVVGDVKQSSLALNEPDAVYLSTAQTWFADDTLSLVVRTRGDAAALAPAVRDAVWSVDKNQPIVRVATVSDLLAVMVAERRFVLVLFEAFGLVALVLAATGIYGVLASTVAERVREIGVRTALGASRANILALIVRQGILLTALGLLIGLGGATLASRAVAALLFGVSRLDPITYAGVAALLLCVSAIACLVPARRAASIDPMQALRNE